LGKNNKLDRNTIKDVAQLAGVGIATVSRALNESGPVSEATRKRILEAIEELQFRPDVIARGLRTSKLPTVGMLVSDITNPLFAEIVQAAHEVLIQSGYELVLGITNGKPKEEERALKSFESRGVSGIIASLTNDSNKQTKATIKGMSIPIILLDRQFPDYEMDAVIHEHAKGSEEAVDYLVNLGHKNIGLVLGSSKTFPERLRKDSLLNSLKNHGIKLPDEYIHELVNPKDGYSTMINLLDYNNPPTSIIVGNNQIFVGVLKALREKNIKYPDDISIISFDDVSLTQLLEKPVTVIKRDLAGFGKEAAQLLVYKIEDSSKGITKRILPTWLEVRESCKSIQ
jgi:LacI family transcriptional regulator